jgi:hypothetical protein
MKTHLWMGMLIVATGLGAYSNSFHGHFIYDDITSIGTNPHIRQLWPPWAPLRWPRPSTIAGRPVASFTLAVNYALGGLDVRGYHAMNLGFHLATALLLFGLTRRTLQAHPWLWRPDVEAGQADSERERPTMLAGAVSLVWTVHPLLTESVNYVIQRTELLMAMFLFLTLYCVRRSADSTRRGWWQAGAVAACLLGMGSKEGMVAAPLIVWCYDRTFLAGSFAAALRQRTGLYAGLAATWLLLAGLVATGPHSESAGFHFPGLTPWRYALTQSGVILHYLRLAVWPRPLTLDYSDWPLAGGPGEVAGPLVVVGILLGASAWCLARRPVLGFVGAWFFLLLAPTSSVLPLFKEFAAERRMYAPLAALVALAVVGGYRLLRGGSAEMLWRRVWAGRVGACVTVLLVALLGCATRERNADYRTEVAIWEDTVRKRPGNARAWYALGLAYATAGRPEEALAPFERAIGIEPDDAQVYYDKGNVLLRLGRDREAIESYARAIGLAPGYAPAHNNLGAAFYRLGRREEARACFQEALRLDPTLADARRNLHVLMREDAQKQQEAVP